MYTLRNIQCAIIAADAAIAIVAAADTGFRRSHLLQPPQPAGTAAAGHGCRVLPRVPEQSGCRKNRIVSAAVASFAATMFIVAAVAL